MSSTRKVRNVNKRYAKINEDWPEKEATVVHKNKVRKKKLSDLGSQWSKDELERFYGAYRKYGKDWRKVAGAVHDRTSDMVEALYNMNRAYLSLPEGTATAAGLIAMMTDHYNILDGSNSDHESNGSPKTSRKPQKRGRAKLQSVSKASDTRYPDLLQSQPASSSYGCLSLLKKKRSGGNKPRAVGKRTPRVPVASMYHRDDKIGPSNRQAKPDANNGDEEGALAALALAEVCQRGSPQVSQTSGRSSGQMFLSPGKSIDRKNADSEMGSSKMHGFQVDADYPEGSLGSREAETGDYPKEASYFLNNEGSASGKSKPKVKRSQKRRKKAAHKTDDQFEDDREACSGTEEGCSSRKAKDIADLDVFGSKGSWPSNKSNKRSRQLFFGDELSALDALHTLADISVNILQPSSIAESESSAQFKDESKDNESDDKPSVPAAVSLFDKKDKPRKIKKIKRQSEIASNEMVTRKKARLSKDHHHDGSTSEVKQDDCKCGVKMEKKKRKSSTLKISKDEKNTLKDSEKTEDIDCMPLHPLENFPESLRRQNIVNKYYSSFSEVKFEDRPKEYGGGGAPRFIPNGDAFDSIAQAKTAANEATVAAQQAMYGQPCTLSQIHEREADIRALAELSRALDKKEALLVELGHMNEEVSGKQKDGETIRDLEHFRKQYAMVLVQLRDSNDHVASALLCLRQRNTFHGQSTQSYPNKSTENGGAFNRTPDPSSNLFGYINQESGSQVMEIIETSRCKAKTMVDVAVQI